MSLSWIVAIVAIIVAWTIAFAAPRRRPLADERSGEYFGKQKRGMAKQWPAWLWAAVLFLAMLLGTLARYYFDLIKRTGKAEGIDIAQMILPLLISPIVFFPVWSQASGQPRTLATALIAFQNGFFWQAIFEKQTPTS